MGLSGNNCLRLTRNDVLLKLPRLGQESSARTAFDARPSTPYARSQATRRSPIRSCPLFLQTGTRWVRPAQWRVWLVLFLALLWEPGVSQMSTPWASGPGSPNVIFLTVDTLRADRLPTYGYERMTMPRVAEFANEATVFTQAVVPRGLTRPSYASMLTGLYPFRHGVRRNEVVLHGDNVTLPEMLGRAGYTTAAFIANFQLLGDFSGIDQGFDLYDDDITGDDRGVTYERSAGPTLQPILRWLKNKPDGPFFLFVNLVDPHGPYLPPPRFRSVFQSQETRLISKNDIPHYQRTDESVDFFDYSDRYDEEILYTDQVLGVLMDQLKASGEWANSLVVFTADHGESMGEHGLYFDHRLHVWEETVRVPLLVRLPDQEGGVASTDRLASPMDLVPTVLDLLDIRTDRELDGTSLLPLIRGEDASAADERALFLEGFGDEFRPRYYAWRTKSHKFIREVRPHDGSLVSEQFFDVGADPLEQHPLADSPLSASASAALSRKIKESEAHTLEFEVTEYVLPGQRIPRSARGKGLKQLSNEQIEKLRSLGYVND